jgi:methane monooxygenase component A gamma chain
MKTPRIRRPLGAQPRLEPSVFGNGALRGEWTARIDRLTTLDDALSQLLEFRENLRRNHLSDVDGLWIEARLEEKVAVLRFVELSFEEIRYRALTGELIADVRARYETAAETNDPGIIENLARDFRSRYKPPIMPTTDFMRTEIALSERLMKRRSLGWFNDPIAVLRSQRGATVLKDGWPD